MDEGLEALNKLLQCITDTRFNTREFVDIALDVEKYNSVIERELKVLNVIKKALINSDKNNYYGVLGIFIDLKHLTQEEFNLLQEGLWIKN